MYWQVYLHKGVLAGDQLLIMMLHRARDLASSGEKLFATPALGYFLYGNSKSLNPENKAEFLEHFSELDDNDIISAAKVWSKYDDPVLRYLCSGFIHRKLFRVEISDHPFKPSRIRAERKNAADALLIPESLASCLVMSDSITNHAYSNLDENIKILGKDGDVRDITEVSEILNVSVLSRQIKKFYICFPKIRQE